MLGNGSGTGDGADVADSVVLDHSTERRIGDRMASLISLLSIAIAIHARGERPMAQKRPTVYEFIPKLGQLRDDVLFGDVWEHPDLSKRDRSLITVAMLAALYRTDEMRGHMQRALDNGVTETELKGLITHVAFYAGWPCAVNAGRIAIDVFGPK
jgi:4-carboxymuconolactone decarboxylase